MHISKSVFSFPDSDVYENEVPLRRASSLYTRQDTETEEQDVEIEQPTHDVEMEEEDNAASGEE